DQLERDQVRKPPAELELTHLPAAPRGADQVQLALADVAVAGRLAPVSLALSAGEHLLVTGATGSGKSTLLEVVAGPLAPPSATVSRARALRIGHLHQDDAPAPGRTAGEHLRRAAGRDEDEMPDLFGLVHPRALALPMATLSRGQLRRLMLAAVLLDPP